MKLNRNHRNSIVWTMVTVVVSLWGQLAWGAPDETTAAATPPPARIVVLRGGTVHPVSSRPMDNGLVVLRNEKIEFVGPADSRPNEEADIDCRGKHIYPGLIDADTSLGLVEIEAVRASVDTAETGSVNPNVKAIVAFNPDSELIPVARADGILIAHTVPQGGVISGQSAVVYLQGWNETDMALVREAGLHIRWPYAGTFRAWWIEQPARRQVDQRARRLRQLEDDFSDARRYREARGSDAGQPFDARLEALSRVVAGDLPVFVHADELRQIQEAVSFAQRQQLKLVIVGGADAMECADLLKKHNVPVIVTGTLRLPEYRHTAYDAPYSLPARLHAAGVRFCLAGQDRFSASGVRNLPQHAGTAAAHGLSPEDALRAITLSAAELLGIADRVGSLEAGKDATLIVTDQDVLEVASHVQLAFIRGAPVDLESRHTRLWQKFQRKYQPENGS